MNPNFKRTALAVALTGTLVAGVAAASSHREAPAITEMPKVDNTDFYMFRSYEEGREGYVTFIANYQGLQHSYGGPNYYTMDPQALYGIHIDSNGDALADLTFYFKFYKQVKGLEVPVGDKSVPVPLVAINPFGSDRSQDAGRNVIERYAVVTVGDDYRDVNPTRNLTGNRALFVKPSDYIGEKTIPEYESYASKHIFRMGFEGCAGEARVFAGQRQEGFAVNLGEVFDLINTNPVGPRDGEINVLEDTNVTSIALEVPIACLTEGDGPIIGAWATAHLEDVPGSGDFDIVSRLSAPLINEVIIGLPNKDDFNSSHPRNDAQFATYVTNPTLPELIQILYPSVTAPNKFPRTDLVAAFLTGIEGLNKPPGVRPAEMMRLNTSIEPKPAAAQSNLGVLGGDLAGFPNGRRPGDDVVDIELRVAMGVLLPEDVAPSGQLPYTDGAIVDATEFLDRFPYLNVPLPGSPNGANGEPGADDI